MVTKTLHTPVAPIAAVAAVGVVLYEVSWAYCKPRPKAPPAGIPFDTVKAD